MAILGFVYVELFLLDRVAQGNEAVRLVLRGPVGVRHRSFTACLENDIAPGGNSGYSRGGPGWLVRRQAQVDTDAASHQGRPTARSSQLAIGAQRAAVGSGGPRTASPSTVRDAARFGFALKARDHAVEPLWPQALQHFALARSSEGSAVAFTGSMDQRRDVGLRQAVRLAIAVNLEIAPIDQRVAERERSTPRDWHPPDSAS